MEEKKNIISYLTIPIIPGVRCHVTQYFSCSLWSTENIFLVILTLYFPSRTQTWLLQKSEIPKLPSHHDSQKENAEKPQETAGPIARDEQGSPSHADREVQSQNQQNQLLYGSCLLPRELLPHLELNLNHRNFWGIIVLVKEENPQKY